MGASVPATTEMGFFSVLAARGSFSAAAAELRLTTPAISKRLAQLELRLGVRLVNRTTRRMSLTPEGEIYLAQARRILADIDDLERQLASSSARPQGLLRVNTTLGFGRAHIAPLVSEFVRRHPQVELQLQLTPDPPALSDDAFDVCVRFGEPPDARVIARRIAPNRRLLCASPAYLERAGTPRAPADLARHNCICIRQGYDAFGTWKLRQGRRTESVKVRGNLSTNDGEIAVRWALDGHGIILRSEWDVSRYLRSGRLVQVLDAYQTPGADIHAVYPQHHQTAARVRAFVDFLAAHFAKPSTRAASRVGEW
jgi:LysR family transcriptional regulator, transcriptional activator for dmlA